MSFAEYPLRPSLKRFPGLEVGHVLYVDLAVVLGGDIHVLVAGVVGLGREDEVAVDHGHAPHDGIGPVDGGNHDVAAVRRHAGCTTATMPGGHTLSMQSPSTSRP